MFKKIFLFTSIIFSVSLFSQKTAETEIRPFRLDLRAGLPNIVGVNIEYLTPVFNTRLAFFSNYNGFNYSVDGVDNKLRYFEIGTNIYISNNGKGLYGSLSYGKLGIKGTYHNILDDEGELLVGGTSDLNVSALNVKAGIKLGGFVYFRAEFGYGFGDVPQEILVQGFLNGNEKSIMIETPDLIGMSEKGYVIANIGIGISFQ